MPLSFRVHFNFNSWIGLRWVVIHAVVARQGYRPLHREEIAMVKPEVIKLKAGYSKYLDREVPNAVAPYLDSRFCQTLNRNQPLALVQGNARSGELLWRNPETAEEFLVPNIWYNQPVEWRIRAMKEQYENSRRRAAKIRELKLDKYWESDSESIFEVGDRSLALAEKMKRTGKVIA